VAIKKQMSTVGLVGCWASPKLRNEKSVNKTNAAEDIDERIVTS
jgi:hypothetical protein